MGAMVNRRKVDVNYFRLQQLRLVQDTKKEGQNQNSRSMMKQFYRYMPVGGLVHFTIGKIAASPNCNT